MTQIQFLSGAEVFLFATRSSLVVVRLSDGYRSASSWRMNITTYLCLVIHSLYVFIAWCLCIRKHLRTYLKP